MCRCGLSQEDKQDINILMLSSPTSQALRLLLPGLDANWFTGFPAVIFIMTFYFLNMVSWFRGCSPAP